MQRRETNAQCGATIEASWKQGDKREKSVKSTKVDKHKTCLIQNRNARERDIAIP